VTLSGRATVPATCGELLQGVDARGPVLVSLPVDRAGSVEVDLVDEPGLRVEPHRPRAAAALRLAVEACGWGGGAHARLGGEVPAGHGLGSSTVDVAGVLCATFAAARRPLDAAWLMRLATAIEPSDTSPLPGLWAVDHTGGGRLRHLGPAPGAWVASVDGGGTVDTLDLHARAGAGPRLGDGEVDALAGAVAAADLGALGVVATASARRNQERLPHPAFGDALDVAGGVGAAGVCAAHSGTLLGVLCWSAAQAGRAAAALSARGWAARVERVSAPGATAEPRYNRASPWRQGQLAQLVRARGSHPRGRGFESPADHHRSSRSP
jgi:L-threonine kinase